MCRKKICSFRPAHYCLSVLSLLVVPLFYLAPAQAATLFEFHPTFFTEEKYDDNIYLTRSKRSDWITTVSPGFSSLISNPRFRTEISYQPGFVYFLHNPQFDYTHHELTINGTVELTPRLTASLYESYIRSNDPDLEEMVDTDYERGIRRETRQIFNRNLIAPELRYSYGRDNFIRCNYRNTNHRSDDPEEDDYRENYFETQLDHWFDVGNGITLLGHFVKGNFDTEADLLHSFEIVPRYRHRFTPHLELYGEYGYGKADFEETRRYRLLENGRSMQTGVDDKDDYDLHKFNFGFHWQLPHNLRLRGSMGYFWRNGHENNDEQGITSLLTIEKATRNMVFNLGWESGYSANYFALRDEGFTKFWEISTGATYTYRQNLELRIRGAYGFEDYTSERGITDFAEDREDYRYLAFIQITYHIIRNFSILNDLALEFTFNHRELDSDLDTEYYINNQTIMKITATF